MTTRKSKSAKASSKTTTRKASAKASASKDSLPSKIYAQVSPRSVSGVSMFEGQEQIRSETVGNFFSESEVVDAAFARLQEAGFEILQISPMTINIAGTPAQFRRAFKTDIVVEDRPVIKAGVFNKVFKIKTVRDERGGVKAVATAGGEESEELPLKDLPKELARYVAGATFSRPPDFGPTSF